MNKLIEFIKRYSKVLFAIYMAIVILVLVLKFPTGLVSNTIEVWLDGGDFSRKGPQLIPFYTIVDYVQKVHSFDDWFIKNLACNIIMFIPHGLLTPLFMKKWKYTVVKVGLSAALISVCIEIFQFVTALGLCDIDDVILNIIGALVGYAIYKLIYSCIRK